MDFNTFLLAWGCYGISLILAVWAGYGWCFIVLHKQMPKSVSSRESLIRDIKANETKFNEELRKV